MKKALLVIDVQNDYFPGGQFPLWNAEATLERTMKAIEQAKADGIPVILVQHVADPAMGVSPFFNEKTEGVAIHPRILAAAGDAPIVVKHNADSFLATDLEKILSKLGVTHLLISGMMTHNCVTHTSISPAAAKYDVSILADCCTTVSEIIHLLALHALGARVPLTESSDAV